MENKIVKMNKVANLLEKIDKKTKEIKQLKKNLQNAFNEISKNWKEESSMLFPQLKPCDIGEHVGVDVNIKGKVYNIFISEYRQKLYCMFSLDRKNKEYYSLSIKDAMDQVDFDKLSVVVNDYLSQNKKKVCSTGVGYYVEFKKEQYDDAFQFYMKIVKTFVNIGEMRKYVAGNDSILEKWRKSNEERGEKNFADDGIMYRGIIKEFDYGTERFSDKEQENKLWSEAPLRILFLTKDQNAGGDEAWDVRGETGNLSYAFFRNLMYQLYGLVNTKPGYKADYNFTNEQAIELYKTFPIARINAKKEAGKSSVSNYTLKYYIERDGKFLKEQILNLDADIIICCGYSDYVEESGNLLLNFIKKDCYNNLENKDDTGWTDEDGWIYYDKKNNKLAINNWHFSARINSEEWYNKITNAYHHFLEMHPDFGKSHRV